MPPVNEPQPRVAFKWPPAEEGDLDVLDLSSADAPQPTANRQAASAQASGLHEDGFDDEAPDLDRPQVEDWDAVDPPWRTRDAIPAVRGAGDALATVDGIARRAVRSVRRWRRERVALCVLALLAIAQAAFIGFKMISH